MIDLSFDNISPWLGQLSISHTNRNWRTAEHRKETGPIRGVLKNSSPVYLEEKEPTSRMDNNNSSTTLSNQNDFLVKMDRMLDLLEPRPLSEACIYRIPMDIRSVNEEAYTPRIVSIGPFHHYNSNLKSMEQLKKGYMKKLVRRNGSSSLKSCIDFVKKEEADIRECYSEKIEMDSEDFRTMVLVDSCFIIQFFIYVYTEWEGFDFSLYINNMTMNRLCLDLMLLENQVPFFVLKELCHLATSDRFSILDLACCFLKGATNTHLFEGFENMNSSDLRIDSIKHFAHMVLLLHQPSSQEQQTTQNENFQTSYSSTELTEAGVTFKEKTTNRGSFDITFNKGVLEIPRLLLTNHTEILIRNIMALELLLSEDKSFLTDYFSFMNSLIYTTKDVELLVHKKIIINYLLDNKEAIDFIRKLFIHVPLSKNLYFSQVFKELNDYYKTPKATLKRNYIQTLKSDYCHTPWKTTATIAAIVLLVLTFIQTVCSIISVKDK
ncbi:hypothetical protein LguiB_027639 [Lonicera macranthoides]